MMLGWHSSSFVIMLVGCWLRFGILHVAMYSVDTILCDIGCVWGERDMCNKCFIYMCMCLNLCDWCGVLALKVGAVALMSSMVEEFTALCIVEYCRAICSVWGDVYYW
jgi:hypothetical protein